MLAESTQFQSLKNGWIQRKDDNTLINLNRYADISADTWYDDSDENSSNLPVQSYVIAFRNANGESMHNLCYPVTTNLDEGQQCFALHNRNWDFDRIKSILQSL